MIDQNVFRAEWAILCDRWNRNPSGPVAARYYQNLSPEMDTDAFRQACAVLFRQSDFFPKPDDFLEALDGPDEMPALEQWELCFRVMQGELHVLDRMSPAGKRVVALLGGVGELRNTPLGSVPFVRREFLAMLGDVTESAAYMTLIGPEVTDESGRIVRGLMRATNMIPAEMSESA